MPHFNPLNPPEDGLEPGDVRFLEARVEPWPDGRRIRVHLTITPFLQRPNISASVKDLEGREICSADIIETMDDRMVFTLHLQGEQSGGHYTLETSLFYDEIGQVDVRHVEFETPTEV